MKIVFMGTPEFAVPSLSRLLEAGYPVAAVYTQSDKPKGRGHKLAASPVKEFALSRGIPVLQPKSLRLEEAAAELAALEPDLIVVAAYGKLLPKAILELPRYGCINVHASLLPKYRGAGPIQWAVIRGETETGVTTMQMAEGIDTGDMLLRAATPIGENETAGELHDRLSRIGAELLEETLRRLEEGSLTPTPQDDSLATSAPMLSRELSTLDFRRPARELHALIRGLSPWPCAEGRFAGERVKIYRAELVFNKRKDGESPVRAGTLLSPREFLVACGEGGEIGEIGEIGESGEAGEGALRLTEVQPEGSRRMSGEEFLRGHRLAGESLPAFELPKTGGESA